jgi:hypothetical protein
MESGGGAGGDEADMAGLTCVLKDVSISEPDGGGGEVGMVAGVGPVGAAAAEDQAARPHEDDPIEEEDD